MCALVAIFCALWLPKVVHSYLPKTVHSCLPITIAPINIIDEWNRHKLDYQNDIIAYFKKAETDNINFFKNNKELSSTYQPDIIGINVQRRIERIDLLFNAHSEKAPIDDSILKDAADRNLKTLAPNHKKDSFRDTVNILSLIAHLKSKGYTNSIFTTLNYKDFSMDSGKRYILHDHLTGDFAAVNLAYIYFDERENFGARLLNELRKDTSLPNFQDYLKVKKAEAEVQALSVKKNVTIPIVENPDKDYLENIKYIDVVLAKKAPTAFDQDLIKSLINRHDSYRQYFLRNVGNNDMV